MRALRADVREGAVFLDRDGVINRTPAKRYVTCWQEFRFLPGVLRALRRLRAEGCRVVILSNQAGVGRGIMPRRALDLITRRMLAAIRRAGGRVEAVYYCTHRPEAACRCRKPRPGLLRRACRELGIDPRRSWLAGDNATDVQMGRSCGCRTVLVLTGASTRADARRMAVRPDRIARDLAQAVHWILRDGRRALPGGGGVSDAWTSEAVPPKAAGGAGAKRPSPGTRRQAGGRRKCREPGRASGRWKRRRPALPGNRHHVPDLRGLRRGAPSTPAEDGSVANPRPRPAVPDRSRP